MFKSWEIFQRGGFVSTLLFTATILSMLVFTASADGFELAYDDGKSDYDWSDFYPMAAMVRFTPPSAAWRITGVRLHALCVLRGYVSKLYVQIRDSGFNLKYYATFPLYSVFKNAMLDWYAVNLPNVVVTGDFYVVIIPVFTLDGSQLWISVDSDAPVNNSFIVNVDTHTVVASMNTSRRPGGFMVRVVGEPVPPPPEIRLSSFETGVEETVLGFNYPGEFKSVEARLIRRDGSEAWTSVEAYGSTIIVRVREGGVLNVYVVTPSSEIVGTSIRIEDGLRNLYKSVLANYTLLKTRFEELSRRLNILAEEKAPTILDSFGSKLTLHTAKSSPLENLVTAGT